jgi:hypothetical protein
MLPVRAGKIAAPEQNRMGWKEAVADAHANEDHRRFIVKVSNTGGKL